MSKYKVTMIYPYGAEDEIEGTFDSYEDAMEAVNDYCTDYNAGGEVLHLSDPDEYPETWDELDYRIDEI